MQTRKIALDFDSTLWPILPAMGLSYEDCPTWDHLPQLCGGVPEMLARFDQVMSHEVMRATPLFAGAADTIRQLHGAGVEIHVMTLRPERFRDDVARILHDNDIPYHQLDCLPKFDKVALCVQRDIRVIIDDSPDTLSAAARQGLTALTLAYPYNEQVRVRHAIAAAPDWGTLGPQLHAALSIA